MIVSCFGVITISQFVLGLYMIADSARRGGEFLAKCRHNSYQLRCFSGTAPTDPTSGLYPMQFRDIAASLSCRTSHHVSRIRYETSPILYHRDTYFDHPTDLLAFSVIVYLVVRSNVYRVPIPSLLRTIAQDATYYFLVIFTSHFAAVMLMLLASVRITLITLCHLT